MNEANELVKIAKSVVASNIDIKAKLGGEYERMGEETYNQLKRIKGADKVTPLRTRNRSNSTFSFVWECEGYTRGDFEASASVAIVVYVDGSVYVTVEGVRPDWGGKSRPAKVLDKKYDWEIPVESIRYALEGVFG